MSHVCKSYVYLRLLNPKILMLFGLVTLLEKLVGAHEENLFLVKVFLIEHWTYEKRFACIGKESIMDDNAYIHYTHILNTLTVFPNAVTRLVASFIEKNKHNTALPPYNHSFLHFCPNEIVASTKPRLQKFCFLRALFYFDFSSSCLCTFQLL